MSSWQRLHFVVTPMYELGNWLPGVFKAWACADHNCGLDQLNITFNGKTLQGSKLGGAGRRGLP